MKNSFFLFVAALFISAAASAQSTVDSIAAKYKLLPMPEALTIEKTFPAIGAYQLTNAADTAAAAGAVTVTLDSVNKGIVWVEGLPVGKFKAYLKQSPATYRIISQKSETGTTVPEGTLLFDAASNTLNIALGKAFDEQNPAEIFAVNTVAPETAAGTEVEVKVKNKNAKTKSKVVFYSAVKSGGAAASVSAVQQ